MITLRDYLCLLFGRTITGNEILLYFSARLDETDTHDDDLLTVVGGAVAQIDQWNTLESKWRAALDKAHVSEFHYNRFQSGADDFCDWGDLKAKRFLARLEKIIDTNVTFRVAVGVDSRVHSNVKERMKGIKGFRADSDYGLCFRWLLHYSCEAIAANIKEDFTISAILEDGPYAPGAVNLFHDLRKMTGGNRPAKHAHRYGDIAVLGKKSMSLQAADAIAGIEADRMDTPRTRQRNRLLVRLREPELEGWYEGMLKEKERRQSFGARASRAKS